MPSELRLKGPATICWAWTLTSDSQINWLCKLCYRLQTDVLSVYLPLFRCNVFVSRIGSIDDGQTPLHLITRFFSGCCNYRPSRVTLKFKEFWFSRYTHNSLVGVATTIVLCPWNKASRFLLPQLELFIAMKIHGISSTVVVLSGVTVTGSIEAWKRTEGPRVDNCRDMQFQLVNWVCIFTQCFVCLLMRPRGIST